MHFHRNRTEKLDDLFSNGLISNYVIYKSNYFMDIHDSSTNDIPVAKVLDGSWSISLSAIAIFCTIVRCLCTTVFTQLKTVLWILSIRVSSIYYTILNIQMERHHYVHFICSEYLINKTETDHDQHSLTTLSASLYTFCILTDSCLSNRAFKEPIRTFTRWSV